MKLFQSSFVLGIFLVLISISTCRQPSKHRKSKTHGSPRLFHMGLPGKIFDCATTVLGSLTEKAFTSLMDKTCRKLIRFGIIGESAGISKYDLSLLVTDKGEVEETILLSDILSFVDSELCSENKTLTVFTPGWLTDLSKGLPGEVRELAHAFGKHDDTHMFAILDFSKYLETTLYSLAALNTEEIGSILGEALAELHQESCFKEFHLIGANLGAHIAGYAADRFSRITGQEIDRITALDPAKACFKKDSPLRSPLNRDSAKFVDVVHTTDILGTDESMGTADFYAKGYKGSRMPGCDGKLTGITRLYKMAISYFAECSTPGLEENCLVCKCKSYLAFTNNKCKNCITVFGLRADPSVTGDYYFAPNAYRPYFPSKKKPSTTTARTTTTKEYSSSTEGGSSADSTTASTTDSTTVITTDSVNPTTAPEETTEQPVEEITTEADPAEG